MSHNLKNAFNDDYDIDEYGDPIRTNSREMKESCDDEVGINHGFTCGHADYQEKASCYGFVAFEMNAVTGDCPECGTTYDRSGIEIRTPNSESDYINMHDYVDDFYREDCERV